eukprot:SAG31_NODE_4374_length_3297_cov_1.307067_5_plen_483_part_00
MEAINGIGLSIRSRENIVAIWVRSEVEPERPFIQGVCDSLRGLLGLKPTARVVHQFHQMGADSELNRRQSAQSTVSLPQTPDYSSDEDDSTGLGTSGDGPLGRIGGGYRGKLQPDVLTEKLTQLASERLQGKQPKDTIKLVSGASKGSGLASGATGHRRFGSSGALGAMAEDEAELDDDSMSDRSSSTNATGTVSGAGILGDMQTPSSPRSPQSASSSRGSAAGSGLLDHPHGVSETGFSSKRKAMHSRTQSSPNLSKFVDASGKQYGDEQTLPMDLLPFAGEGSGSGSLSRPGGTPRPPRSLTAAEVRDMLPDPAFSSVGAGADGPAPLTGVTQSKPRRRLKGRLEVGPAGSVAGPVASFSGVSAGGVASIAGTTSTEAANMYGEMQQQQYQQQFSGDPESPKKALSAVSYQAAPGMNWTVVVVVCIVLIWCALVAQPPQLSTFLSLFLLFLRTDDSPFARLTGLIIWFSWLVNARVSMVQ